MVTQGQQEYKETAELYPEAPRITVLRWLIAIVPPTKAAPMITSAVQLHGVTAHTPHL